MLKPLFYHTLLLFCAASMFSCDVSYFDQEIDEALSWEGNAQLPLGSVNYTLSELFEELGADRFDLTSSESLKFSYMESFSGNDDRAFDVQIPNKTIRAALGTPITAENLAVIGENYPYVMRAEILPGVPNPLIGERSLSNQTVTNLDLSQDLTRVSFEAGILDLTFTSTFDAQITVVLEIPSFVKKTAGTSYQKTVVFDGAGTQTVRLNLSDYDANLTHDGNGFDRTHNRLVLQLDAAYAFAAGDVLQASDSISCDAVLSGVRTEVVYGDFKQEAFAVSAQSFALAFFDNFGDGDLSFTEPRMTLTATNDYGFPIGVDLSQIRSRGGAETIALSYTENGGLPNTFLMEGLANFGDAPKTTSIVLDKNNSNIAALLASKPSQIDLHVSGMVNPIQAATHQNFYATDNQVLQVDLELAFDEVNLQQMIAFDAENVLDDLKNLRLMVDVSNEIPMTGRLLLRFQNALGEIVHRENLTGFLAAHVDSNGASDGIPVTSRFEIDWDAADIAQIDQATDLQIVLTLLLPEGTNEVLLKGSDALRLSIGTKIQAAISNES
jgi:hypothetical protein